MNQNNSFEVDWEATPEEVIHEAEALLGKLPLTYKEERNKGEDWFFVVLHDGKEVLINQEPEFCIPETIDLINQVLKEQKKQFNSVESMNDSYIFELVSSESS